MAQVIYMPPSPSVGEALGQGFGSVLMLHMHRQQQQKEVQQMQMLQSSVEQAVQSGGRQAGLEIMNKIPYKTLDQYQKGMQWFNTISPPKDLTPREVSTFDPQTGQETKQFVRTGDLTKFSAAAQQAGQTLAKPDVTDFYSLGPGGTYQNLGRAPVTNRPPGSHTLEELKLVEQQRTDQLKLEAANRSERKFQFAMDKLAESKDKQEASKQMTEMKAYNGVVSSMLNVKKSIGMNGEIILDFGGDSKKADAYREALTKGSEYLAKYKGDINKAASEALSASGAFDQPMPEAPTAAPAQQEGGAITRLYQALKERITGQPESAAKAPVAKAPAPVFDKGKIYVDAKGNRAKYLGNNKWENL